MELKDIIFIKDIMRELPEEVKPYAPVLAARFSEIIREMSKNHRFPSEGAGSNFSAGP